jgi:hypothetical protein
MSQETQYEYYRCIQRDFNEAYKLLNSYVSDLYVLPKKFVENTGPALDRYIKDYSFDNDGKKNATSYDVVLDFIEQLDDFTENTMKLFNQHKLHNDRSKAYLRKVDELNQKAIGKIVSEYAVDFIELTPELTQLQNGLKQIKVQADEMVDKLERLELRWDSLKVNVRRA